MKLTFRVARFALREKSRSLAGRLAGMPAGRAGSRARRLLASQRGFTYLGALVLVIILGIVVSGSVTSWSMKAKRDKEDELLYDLAQYRDAMRRWYKLGNKQPGAVQAPLPLMDLKDLLKDPKSPTPVKYLRRLFLDPITGKEFQVIKDLSGRIVGVKSSSEAEPVKKANFPDEFIAFEGKMKYSEWEFNCFMEPPKKQTGVTQQGLNGSGTPGNPPPPPPTPPAR